MDISDTKYEYRIVSGPMIRPSEEECDGWERVPDGLSIQYQDLSFFERLRGVYAPPIISLQLRRLKKTP